MAITPVTLNTKFREWKDITNDIITALGDNTSLTTTEQASLVGAINELDALIGNLANLNTTIDDNLVNAINEVLADMGDVANLNTISTDTVAAINELLLSIGDLTSLATTNQTNLVLALNEIHGELGDLTSLTTTANTDTVVAINEVDADIGDLTTLTTTATGSAVAAINELDAENGDLSSLNTTEQGSLVGAINEVDLESMEAKQVPYPNSEPTGGRNASDNLSTIAVTTFDASSGLMAAYNSATFNAGAQFINDNANYGGGGGTMGADMSTLVAALGTKGGRTNQRYGYEFYMNDITSGANTQNGQVHLTLNYYPIVNNDQRMLAPIGREVTFMCWIKLKTLNTPANNGMVLGDGSANQAIYIDGASVSNPYLLTTAAGWVHYKEVLTLDQEFVEFFPAIYANNLDVVQMALSVVTAAEVGHSMHVGLVN